MPPLRKFVVVEKGSAGSVAIINDRGNRGAANLIIVIYGIESQVENDVGFRAAPGADEPGDKVHGEKEKARVLIT